MKVATPSNLYIIEPLKKLHHENIFDVLYKHVNVNNSSDYPEANNLIIVYVLYVINDSIAAQCNTIKYLFYPHKNCIGFSTSALKSLQ